MKPIHDWHRTRFGRAALFLGGIRFAVPVLLLVAAALAWGTYLESMHDARVSRATVYGAWWFIALMGMIALSLIFAVITRFPWQRRHVGFITVHAGLVMLIVAGFWSLFGRLEGHVVLEEGQTSNVLETDQEVLEVAEFNAGQSTIRGTVAAPVGPGTVEVGGQRIVVRECWDYSQEEQYVADGGDRAVRAVEVSLDPTAAAGDWIADEAQSAGSNVLGGLRVRVLADGQGWDPPVVEASDAPPYYFIVGGTRYEIGERGAEVFPGWKVESVEQFSHALVSSGRISEAGSGESNPAIDVTIRDGQGTVERHTAFLNFPDMVLAKRIEGTGASGARLTARATQAKGEQLVVFGPLGATRVGYVAPDGSGRELPGPVTFPAVFDLGPRKVSLLKQFGRAHVATRVVRAPKSSQRRPALVLEFPGSSEPRIVAFKSFAPMTGGGGNFLLRFGPRVVELPFSLTLKDFRKMDYPGTEMAMAYESEVTVNVPGKEPLPFLVHMNSPYAQHPWKVYQSGFMGESISIFSVMKDPGLPLTYAASIVLCVGIFLTFFSRRFSWGHPGIPAAFSAKAREANVPQSAPVDPAPSPVVVRERVPAGVGGG